MKWWDAAYLAKYGAPSKRQVDVEPSYAPAERSSIGETRSSAQPAASSFDPAKHQSEMAMQPADVVDAVRLAVGVTLKRLPAISSIRVKYFSPANAPAGLMGASRVSEPGIIYLRSGMSPEDSALTVAHEIFHDATDRGMSQLSATGRFEDACTVDAISERMAVDFEAKLGPLIRHKLREGFGRGFPWQHGIGNRELRV